MAESSNGWGPVLFATLVPIGLLILGGLINIFFRLGRLTQQVTALERRVPEIPYAAAVGAAAGAAAGTQAAKEAVSDAR